MEENDKIQIFEDRKIVKLEFMDIESKILYVDCDAIDEILLLVYIGICLNSFFSFLKFIIRAL